MRRAIKKLRKRMEEADDSDIDSDEMDSCYEEEKEVVEITRDDMASSEGDMSSEDPVHSLHSSSQPQVKKLKSSSSSDQLPRFPSARHLRSEIVNLKANIVQLPSSTESFAEPPHRLLAVLYAYAQQNNFALWRRSKMTLKSTFHLYCSHGDAKIAGPSAELCGFSVCAKLGGNGFWTLLPSTTQHNHQVESSVPRSPATYGIAAQVDDFLHPLKNRTLPTLPPHASTSRALVVPPSYQHLLSPRFESPAPTNVTPSSDLAALLRPFHSSLLETLVYLHSIGVDSVETLTQLLMIEVEGFERFIGGIKIEIRKKLRTMRNDLQEELAG
ncbi:hypothetical protein JCM5353_000330 [Sporobolomyces roseus]